MISHYHNYFIVPLQGRHQEITMSTCKNFKLVDPESPGPSTSQHPSETNWKLCIICQKEKSQQLTHHSQLQRTYVGSGYTSLAKNNLANSVSWASFHRHCSWRDSTKDVALKPPWSLTMHRITTHAGSNSTTQCGIEQKHGRC